jgi:N-acetylglutamate synthase-like GNAT family acetyltransferase
MALDFAEEPRRWTRSFPFDFEEEKFRIGTMIPITYRVRRATLDDITGLSALWRSMQLPAQQLEKRLTEFQLAESHDGKLLGAVGLQIVGQQGRLHSEAFTDFSIADQVRPLLWERMQAIATNHGLTRLWTQEHAPFWKHYGLHPAAGETMQKLPPAWRVFPGEWLAAQLKEETEAHVSAEKEFALFMEAEKQRTERAFRQARVIKHVATLAAVLLAIFVLVALVFWLKRNPPTPGP